MSVVDTRTVFVLGLSSDIGRELGRRFLESGWRVAGTYRTAPPPGTFDPAFLFHCDVTNPDSVREMTAACRQAGIRWDVFIGAVGTEEPIGRFFECDFDEWAAAVDANAVGVLRSLHAVADLRAAAKECACVLFSGAGTNNAAVNYSAYSASKVFLIKMSELLAAENEDLNVVIIGPGIVRTKMHQQTLNAGRRSGANYDKVVRFLDSPDRGVSHEEIFACVNWCVQAGRAATGGRNVSLAHDAWRDGGVPLTRALKSDPEMYTLRRHKNDWRPS
jgi:NAD(P)-dependent dehydrogenase (short-subunit alcohol dehydrogenase family)